MKTGKTKSKRLVSKRILVCVRVSFLLMFLIFGLPAALLADNCFSDPLNAND